MSSKLLFNVLIPTMSTERQIAEIAVSAAKFRESAAKSREMAAAKFQAEIAAKREAQEAANAAKRETVKKRR